MNAYIASVEIEMPIYAKNEEEAREIAKEYFKEEMDSCPLSDNDFFIRLMTRIPDGSELDSFCWSTRHEETISVEEGIKLTNEI
jgi:hypothetical protein